MFVYACDTMSRELTCSGWVGMGEREYPDENLPIFKLEGLESLLMTPLSLNYTMIRFHHMKTFEFWPRRTQTRD